MLSATPSVDTLSASVNPENNNDTLSVQENDILSAGSDSGSDNLLGDSQDDGSFTDLDLLIKSSDVGSTIDLGNNFTFKDGDKVGGITIAKSLTIDGHGYTIDAKDKTLIFKITADNVVLKDVHIINGYGNGEMAGAIHWLGDNGKFIDSSIYNCHVNNPAASSSGAICWEGNNGTVHNSKFSKSYHQSETGQTFAYLSAGIFVTADKFSITDSTFINFGRSGNSNYIFAPNDINSVLQLYPLSTESTVTNCDFIDCYSNYMLFILSTYVKDCSFTANVSNSNGQTCSPFYNSGPGSTFDHCYFEGYYGNFKLDGVAPVHLINSTFKNIAGNIFNAARTNVIVDGCTFNNTGVLAVSSGSRISNSLFINSTRNSRNVELSGTGAVVDNCIFQDNKLPTNQYNIIISGKQAEVSNCVFENNTAKYGIFVNSGSTADISVNNDFTSGIPNNYVNNTYNSTDISFVSTKYVWVSNVSDENPDGSYEHPYNLTTALSIVETGGVVYLKKGIYDELTTRQTIYCSIIGREPGVIINNGTFYMNSLYNNISGITFNRSVDSLRFAECTIVENCNFTNINLKSKELFATGYVKESSVSNIRVENSTLNIIFNSNSPNKFSANHMTFYNCSMNYFAKVGSSFYNTYSDITFEKSNISSIYYANGFTIISMTRGNNASMTFKDCNITSSLIDNQANMSPFLDYSYDLRIEDCNVTSSNPLFKLYYNNNVKATVKNLGNSSNINIFEIVGDGNSINNVELDSLSADTIVNSGKYVTNFNNVSVKNVNAKKGLVILNSVLNKVNVTDSDFEEFLGEFNGTCNLVKSEFNTVNGSLIFNGINTKLSETKFIKLNSTMDDMGCIILNNTHIVIEDCSFIDNNASYGAAIYIGEYNDTSVRNSIFINNRASVGGGALYTIHKVYFDIDVTTMENITRIFDDTDNIKVNTLFAPNRESTYNIIYVYYDAPNMASDDGLSFNTTDIRTAFGLINTNGKIICPVPGENFTFHEAGNELRKSNVEIIGNNTRIFVNHTMVISSVNVTVNGFIFENSSQTVINWTGDDGKIINCTFQNNEPSDDHDACDVGGALVITGNNMQINNTNFINNTVNNPLTSNSDGGAIWLNASDTVFNNCTFEGNKAQYGSHIHITSDCVNTKIIDSRFYSGESALSSGGSGILFEGFYLTVENTNFTDNVASNGGALNIKSVSVSSPIVLNSNEFVGNNASDGGALHINKGDYRFHSNLFEDNYAVNGGAIYVNDVLTLNGNNNFVSNNATNGGAIYVNVAGTTLSDCDFTSNNAVNGGAVYVNVAGTTLSDCDFTGNNATLGGALYVDANNTWVWDSNFIGNTANDGLDSYGSAIYVADDILFHMRNGKLVDNHVYGEDSVMKHADISFGNVSPDLVGVNWGSTPYTQYAYNRTPFTYTTAFISNNGVGTGFSSDSPTTLSKVLETGIKDNGFIYLVGDEDIVIDESTLNSIKNLTVVNYPDGKNRKIKGNDKYLFNPLKKIKNLSLNNYLSSQSLRIKKIKNVQNTMSSV